MFHCIREDCAALSCSPNETVCWMLDHLELGDPLKVTDGSGMNVLVDESAVNLEFSKIEKQLQKWPLFSYHVCTVVAKIMFELELGTKKILIDFQS